MFSVIIPTRHRPIELEAALASVALQDISDIEVIVVNDGGVSVQSTVDSWSPHLNIRYLSTTTCLGPASARNLAISAATREFVAFLDDDDLFLPGHLKLASTCLKKHDECSAYYAGAYYVDKRADPGQIPTSHIAEFKYTFHPDLLLVTNFMHTGSIVVKRSLISSLQSFDTSMQYCEDWEMWLRLHFEGGCKFYFNPAMTAIYHKVDSVDGLLEAGRASIPSPFSLARDKIYDQWPVPEGKVAEFRDWMSAFDWSADQWMEMRGSPAKHAYQSALRYVAECFDENKLPSRDVLMCIFPGIHLN